MDNNLKLFIADDEVVKPIPNFEDYLITSTGRIFSTKKRVSTTTLDNKTYEAIIYKELKPSIVRGYKTVNLSNGKTRKKFYIHELMFNTFLGQFDKHYFKIRHNNRNKLDNSLDNLSLEFRKKDKKFIDKYVYQTSILNCLNEY